MMRIRRKRASPTDLHRSCALGGDCFPDVENKLSGNTLADILLKAFGSILYLGNLGIGTGKGGGGQYGYTPFGGTRPSISRAPVRPAIPVDTVVPGEVLPVTPLDPAIVPLTDGLPEPAVIDVPGAGPGLPTETIDVTTELDLVSEVTGVGEHPSVTYDTNNVAQIDVQVQPPPPKRILLDTSITDTELAVQTHASHVDEHYNVFVDAQFHGEHIGAFEPESIELQEINLRQEFEIDEGPLRSTPLSSRAISRARDLYNRYVQQVPTTQLASVSTPRVTFEFENPAFEAEIADVFNREVQELATQGQDEAGTDLIRLSDIRYGESPAGTVRVSRLGQREGMIMRSGLQVGQRVHFYYDISPIPKEAIELRTFGEYSHEYTVVDDLASSSFINPFEQPVDGSLEFSDAALIDSVEEDFSGTHLILTSANAADSIDIPVIPPGIGVRVFVDDYAKGLSVLHPTIIDNGAIYPTDISSNILPLTPSFSIDVNYSDYNIHPANIRRKRKHSSSLYF
ncbi:L2 protein [Human papillomavirus 116]|uniref:Minor capsid protein L2 n=1 Tax=Human papillomavirus 116 TaxID=915428 RepID=C7B7D7_9PAPI|nr:L2 protein [Human papillomavirus 116]ACT76417.1 L2 protein [Human papillomavirus 116]